jgi:cyclic pyranopterin monophosphate synthase
MSGLSHLDAEGRARMVDVSDKPVTAREAVAEGYVRMSAETRALALSGQGKKGEVIATAELAGVMAAKRTADLIPLCHPLPLTSVKVAIEPSEHGLRVVARVKTTGQTGVEMEALIAVSLACLTLFDMLKAADKTMTIEGVRVLEKSGGRSGHFIADVPAT